MEQGQSRESYRFGDVEVDVRRHRLLRGGNEVALEPKAYAVLLELLRHAGGVVGRDALLDTVWGHRHVTPAVLNRIVAILRRELRDDADHPHWIRTVHGVGYEFIGTLETTADGPEPPPAADDVPVPAPAPAAPEPVPRPPARARPVVLALLALAAALAFYAGWPSRHSSAPPAAPAAEPRSIAVLPLVNASGEADQQFFSDGLSENLITTLSQFEGLKVLGRGSSFRFRDHNEDGKAIGAKLGVAHLIEGSVQRAGDSVRIGIELVRTADGSIVWTQRFDRPYKDLFALQDEVALAVAGALQVRLLHAMPGAVEAGRPASGNLDAYAAYLRGTHYMGGGKDLLKAIDHFAEATRVDPGYAQAWSWLGFMRTQNARGNLDGEAARAAYAQARREIDTALKLAPDFGQAHAIRANLLSSADHDWNGALAEFRMALPLVAANDPSHGAASRLLATLGKINEAIEERRKYIDGDPLAGFARVYLAELLASLGRLDEADANLRKANEVEPDESGWYASERSYLAILRGDAETARAEAMREPPGHWRDRVLALALQIGPDRAAADAALQRLIDTFGQGKGGAYAVARVHALRGDADQAFEWLQRDRERGDAGVHAALWDPLLLRFRNDVRFAEYCRQTGLPPPSASEALGLDQIRRIGAAADTAH
jgi:TolB-like protein/DNA-binding winged helix-turn-helix (wHTH) protein/Tfp pilus assembly protein PilF